MDNCDLINRQIDVLHQMNVVRWYILILPGNHRGKPSAALEKELDRRKENGEKVYEFFAPTMVSVSANHRRSSTPLLYNYIFIKASVKEILELKEVIPQYNFLRKRRYVDEYENSYPFLTDEEIETLRWVAKAYNDVLPVFSPDASFVTKGDKVRITTGNYEGIIAEVATVKGSKSPQVFIRLPEIFNVPLCNISPTDYEVIEINESDKSIYDRLNNDRYNNGLHKGLENRFTATVTQEDRDLATEVVNYFKNLKSSKGALRTRKTVLLLKAYTVLGDEENRKSIMSEMIMLAQLTKSINLQMLIYTTIYGCTDSSIYYNKSHELLGKLTDDSKLRKSQVNLISHLKDYDRWFGNTQLNH